MNLVSIAYYFMTRSGCTAPFSPTPPEPPRTQLPTPRSRPDLQNRGSAPHRAQLCGPAKQGEQVQQCMKLYYREMLEPTGIWQDEIETSIRPLHGALTAALTRHLGLATPDDEVRRLAFAIAGLGRHGATPGHEVVSALAPATNRHAPRAGCALRSPGGLCHGAGPS